MRAERKLNKLGQYSLEEKIGEGGMGEVYRSTHRMLRRPTAVKLLPAEKSSPQTIERFEREVQLTSELTHPNTISIYDYGRTSDGVFYYAMEYLDGVDLKRLVEMEGAQPEARVVHVLRQICGSLKEAHGRDLVHRDIKPANVILCSRGGQYDVAKVLDFGLVYDTNSLRASMTKSGVSGTPAFMSPESIESPASVDQRSDIYSIGAVAYFLLTGRYTFTGSSVSEVWDQQLSKQPPSPSDRTAQPISQVLEDLVMRCLAIDPRARPQSISEVERMLDLLPNTWSPEDALQRWNSSASDSQNASEQVGFDQPAETLAYAV
jgi:serine/threonine-protein kinase